MAAVPQNHVRNTSAGDRDGRGMGTSGNRWACLRWWDWGVKPVNLMLFVKKKKKEIKVGPEIWGHAEQDKGLGSNLRRETDRGRGEDVRDRERSWESMTTGVPWGAARLRVQARTGGAAAEGGSTGTQKGGCGPC